jgi:TP901 family phage tail tape measure protein
MAIGALKYTIEVDDKGNATIKKFDDVAGKSLDKQKKKSGQLGKSFMKVTKLAMGVAAAIGVIGAVTLGGALAKAIGFESAWAGVTKTVEGTESQLANLRQGIKDMGGEIPASTKEIAAVAEAAGQLGIQTDNILDFTRTMLDLGETTNLSSEEAATALARLANITQMPQENFDRLGSTIVALGNNLATTEADIVAMASRLAGAGTQIGLSEHQILSLAGALSSVGIEAEAGGSAFSQVMLKMNTAVAEGGTTLEKWSRIAGESASDFAETFRTKPQVALTEFITGLAEMKAAGQNVSGELEALQLSGIRVQDALLRASGAGSLFKDALELGAEAWEENNALQDEARQRYETTSAQLGILGNMIGGIFTNIGEGILPAFKEWIARLQEFIRYAQDAGVIEEVVDQVVLSVDAASEALERLADWGQDWLDLIREISDDPAIEWADVMFASITVLGHGFRWLLIEAEKNILAIKGVFAILGKAASEVWDLIEANGKIIWLVLQAAALGFLGAIVDKVFTPLKGAISALVDHLATIAFVIPGMEETGKDLLKVKQSVDSFGTSVEGATARSKELVAEAKAVSAEYFASRTMSDEYGQEVARLTDRINKLNEEQARLGDADYASELEKNAAAAALLVKRQEKQIEITEKLTEASQNWAEAQKVGGEFAAGAAAGLIKYAEAAEQGGFKTDEFKVQLDGARAFLKQFEENAIAARKGAAGLTEGAGKLSEKFGLLRADEAAKSMADMTQVMAALKVRGIESGPVFDKIAAASFKLARDIEAAGLKLEDPFKTALEGIAGPGGEAALAVDQLVEQAERGGPAYDAMRAELEEINLRLADTANQGPEGAAGIAAMKDRALELTAALTPATHGVEALVAEFDNLKKVQVKQRLDEAREALDRMRNSTEYTSQAIHEQEQRVRDLEGVYDPLGSRMRDIREEATKSSPAFEDLKLELAASKGVLAGLEQELGKTSPEVIALRNKIYDLERQLDPARAGMDGLAYSMVQGVLGAQSLSDGLFVLGNTLASAFQQGGDFGSFLDSLGDMFSTEGMSTGEKFGLGLQAALGAFQDDTLNMGGKLAAAAGAGIGGFFGGPLGAAVGGKVGKWLGGLFGGKADWVKITEDVEKNMGVAISEGTARAIADLGDELDVGNDIAQLLGLNRIVAEADLAGDGIERFGQTALDALSLVAQGGEVGKKALKAADETIGMLIDDAIEFGNTGDASFRQFIAAAQDAGVEVEALAEFIEGRLMMAVEGVTLMYQHMGDVGQAEFNDLALIGNAVMQGLREEVGLMGAMEAMIPGIDAMVEAQQRLGLELNEDAAALVRMKNLFENNQDTIASIDGVQMAMQGLAEAGHLNAATFDAFQRQTIRNNEKLLAGGFSQTEALEAQQPILQEIINHHLATGDAIDAETLAMIQQAEAAGLVNTAGTGIEIAFRQVGQAIIDVMGEAFGVEVPRLIGEVGSQVQLTTQQMQTDFETSADATVEAWTGAHEEVSTEALLLTEEVTEASKSMIDEITGATEEGTEAAAAALLSLEETAVLAATGTADATAGLVATIAQKTAGFVGEASRDTIGFLDGIEGRLQAIFAAKEAALAAEADAGGGQQYPHGGWVTGKTGTAHQGEYVIKKESAQQMDPNVLAAINRTGAVPARAVTTAKIPEGGSQAKADDSEGTQGQRGPVSVNLSGRMVIVLEDGTELKGTIRQWTQDQADDGSLIIGPDNIRDRRR